MSDWSSDVCSADLCRRPSRQRRLAARRDAQSYFRAGTGSPRTARDAHRRLDRSARGATSPHARGGRRALRHRARDDRSEEHTSELQSLMRISYAVFCLKKKKTRYTIDKTTKLTDISY